MVLIQYGVEREVVDFEMTYFLMQLEQVDYYHALLDGPQLVRGPHLIIHYTDLKDKLRGGGELVLLSEAVLFKTITLNLN